MASVLDMAVSLSSECSNCWPNPCALHTVNLRPHPETTVMSLTLRQSSNDWIITTQEFITADIMHEKKKKCCPVFLYFQTSGSCWKTSDTTLIEILIYTCSQMDTPIFSQVTGTDCWRNCFHHREAAALVNWQSTVSMVHIYQRSDVLSFMDPSLPPFNTPRHKK